MQDLYASKLKKRLQFAYKVESQEAQKAAERNKANMMLRSVKLLWTQSSDHVLIKQVAVNGSETWVTYLYVVIFVPTARMVQKESNSSDVKIVAIYLRYS